MELLNDFDWLDFIKHFIADCQSGFFLYTLVYFGFRIWRPTPKLQNFDRCATIVICAVSSLYLVWYIGEIATMYLTSEERWTAFSRRWSGKYGFSLWLPQFFYMVLPQVLWIRKIRENCISRFVIAFFLFFNFEKFVIIVTSLHRDYLPSSWGMPFESDAPVSFIWLVVFGLIGKFVLFTGLTALLFSLGRKKRNFAS